MTRKLIATGIAVVVCIPLIPILKKGFGYLTGTNSSMVFAGRGWTLEHPKAPAAPAQVVIDLTGSMSTRFEARGAAGGERVWFMVRPQPEAWLFGRLRNAYEAGDLKFEVLAVTDSGRNHAMPSGAFGAYYFGFPKPPAIWAGLSMDSDGDGLSNEFVGSATDAQSDRRLLANLALFRGGANQHMSYMPLIRSVSPSSGAGAGSTTVAVLGTRSGFATGAVVLLDSSGSMASSKYSAMTLIHELGHSKPGWYSLSIANHSSQTLRDIDVEFAPDSGGASVRYTLKDSGTGGHEAGLIHLNEPGSITIRGTNIEPKLQGLEFADFISRAFDITLQKALLTVFLLAEVLPLSAWILMVWKVRSYAYEKIRLLPRLERKHARHEIDLMLNFAKWCGVSCYLLWTAKDILVGAGIVFAGG